MRLFSKQFLYIPKIVAVDVTQVSCNQRTTFYLTKNGELYGCGAGGNGQQGNGTTDTIYSFLLVAKNVKSMSCSPRTTWYIDNNDDLYGCGHGEYGQQGNNESGSSVNITTFYKRGENVKKVIALEKETWYLTNDGDLYGCGYNGYGQQSSGNTTNVTTFTQRASNVKDFDAGDYVIWYLTNDNELYGCGYGGYGQQGNGSTSNVNTFTKRAENVKQFTCQKFSCWYINNNNELYGCGAGTNSQQSNGTRTNVTTFTKRADNAKFVQAGRNETWYIDLNGDLYGCGSSDYYQQGTGSTSEVATFTKRAENVRYICPYTDTLTWYVTNDDELYGCGNNANGNQGTGNTTDVRVFTKRGENVLTAYASCYNTFYLTKDGELYGCGEGDMGNQANGTSNDIKTFEKKTVPIYKPVTPPQNAQIYEFIIDKTDSNPATAVHYTGVNTNYTPASMNFTTGTINYGSWENSFFLQQIRPVMLNFDGTVECELDKNDFSKTLLGASSDYDNPLFGGNCVIGFPKIWAKVKYDDENETLQHVWIANYQADEDYYCYTHQNTQGQWLDEVYINAYEPSIIQDSVSGNYIARSLANQTIASGGTYTLSTYISYLTNSGNGAQLMDFGQLQIIWYLYLLLFRSLDSQTSAGAGISNGTSSTYTTTGATYDRGMFYAICNDGESIDAITPIKFLGIENLWGNLRKSLYGYYKESQWLKIKLSAYYSDGSRIGWNTDYYRTQAQFLYSGNRTQKKFGVNSLFGLIISTNDNSATDKTYLCDGIDYSSNTYTHVHYGGGYSDTFKAGLFANHGWISSETINSLRGFTLAFKPILNS